MADKQNKPLPVTACGDALLCVHDNEAGEWEWAEAHMPYEHEREHQPLIAVLHREVGAMSSGCCRLAGCARPHPVIPSPQTERQSPPPPLPPPLVPSPHFHWRRPAAPQRSVAATLLLAGAASSGRGSSDGAAAAARVPAARRGGPGNQGRLRRRVRAHHGQSIPRPPGAHYPRWRGGPRVRWSAVSTASQRAAKSVNIWHPKPFRMLCSLLYFLKQAPTPKVLKVIPHFNRVF